MKKHNEHSDDRVVQMLQRYVKEQHAAAAIRTRRERPLGQRIRSARAA